MTFTRPSNIPIPFASSALTGYINTLPTTPSGSNLASWPEGFPPVTMTLAGGLPPEGQDFNGVLNRISAGLQWAQAGGAPAFDSTLATAIGGYPKGAVLALNDGFTFVISLADNNMHDPNVAIYGVSNWVAFGGTLACAGNFGLDTGIANAYVVTMAPVRTVNYNGVVVEFLAGNTNTGPSTLNIGAGPVALVRSDGASLVAGDIHTGQIYTAMYFSTIASYVIMGLVNSQINALVLPATVTFSAQYDVTSSRVTATTYTNATGKPMFVSVAGNSTGGNNNLAIAVNGIIINQFGQGSALAAMGVSGMVPAGAAYQITSTGVSITRWIETY